MARGKGNGPGRPKGTSQTAELRRIADSLETLVRLYRFNLRAMGILPDQPVGEGGLVETDDDKIAAVIERRLQRLGIPGPGWVVEDEPIPRGVPSEEPRPESSGGDALLEHSWGFNVGPEGAETGWPSISGERSEGEPVAGHVQGPSDSPEPEG